VYFHQLSRKPGTKSNGSAFSHEEKVAVFIKGAVARGYDSNRYRLDACGALMDFYAYGDTTPKGFGWEIDHIHPVAKGGKTVLANLQPLQWQNNRSKSDNSDGTWACAVRFA
jgi:hypothetical protein